MILAWVYQKPKAGVLGVLLALKILITYLLNFTRKRIPGKKKSY